MTGDGAGRRLSPMFPLGRAMLPGSLLQLHVFEPRYRQMVEDLLSSDPAEFGVVLISRGSEVGGGDQRTTVGSVARIVEVARSGDGRYGVVAAIVRRVRVHEWLVDDPYPRAVVEDWPDLEESVDPTQMETLTGRVRAAAALAVELGDHLDGGGPLQPLGEDPTLATYQLAALAPLGDADRQRLLEAPGPAGRLAELARMLDDIEPVLTFRLGG